MQNLRLVLYQDNPDHVPHWDDADAGAINIAHSIGRLLGVKEKATLRGVELLYH